LQSDHAAFVGDRLKFFRLAIELNFERSIVEVPAEFFAEQRRKIEFLQKLTDAMDVERHGVF
jgi:hypothetical protein